MFNPGAVVVDGRVALIYRAVGSDGLSRFGMAWSPNGETIEDRSELPWYEGALDDPFARLGVEDPRITPLDGAYYLTYCKASVESAGHPKLSWEPAPFRVRTGMGRSEDLSGMVETGTILPQTNTKDGVLFPEKIGGRYAALVRIYPSIQLVYSDDLEVWSQPIPVMGPIPNTWQGERVGAGPPPLSTDAGWLLFYHGNEFLQMPGNRRLYSMGLALLDLDAPERVLYRHPDPIFVPEAPYEVAGPVGNVVFGTGLAELDGRIYMYYGAGDGVIGAAWADRDELLGLVTKGMS